MKHATVFNVLWSTTGGCVAEISYDGCMHTNTSDVLVERQVAASGYAEHTLFRDVWYRHSEHQDAVGLVEFGDYFGVCLCR